jgi:hypothetical protein
MNASSNEPTKREIFLSAGAIALFCLALTALLVSVAPPWKAIPRPLEIWIAYGWVTGLYLSASYAFIRSVFTRVLSPRAMECHDIAHSLQLPIVIAGVGTWAVVKALGF